ncbi:MAG: hypothetical protein U0414_12595 [Polyangiaceae bacterium]
MPGPIEVGEQRGWAELLWLTCHVSAGRHDAILESFAEASDPALLLGALRGYATHGELDVTPELLDIVVGHVCAEEPHAALMGLEVLTEWLDGRATLPTAQLERLVGTFGVERSAKWGNTKWDLGTELVVALVPVAAQPGSQGEELAALVRPKTRDANKAMRKRASYLLTARAIATSNALELGTWLGDRDASIRSGAMDRVMHWVVGGSPQRYLTLTDDAVERASSLLPRAGDLSTPRARCGLAEGICDALAPRRELPPSRNNATKEAKELIKKMSHPDAQQRRESARLAGLALDMVDCRVAAPFLAATLFDEEVEIRRAAADALYFVVDLTGGAPVVRVTVRTLERALASEKDAEARERIDAILRAAAHPAA